LIKIQEEWLKRRDKNTENNRYFAFTLDQTLISCIKKYKIIIKDIYAV
jgi:hypothetical protein